MLNCWYALYVQARHEKSVATILSNKGFETCLPLIRSKRDWCDREKWLELPAFPGYLFCNFEAGRRGPILATPGVVAIVGAGKNAVPIEAEEMESIRVLERARTAAERWPYLKVGERVRIEGGALDGLTGILADCRKSVRVVVSVALLQRSVAIEVDRDQVAPVPRGLEATAGR